MSASPFSEHSVPGLSREVNGHPQCLRPHVSPRVFPSVLRLPLYKYLMCAFFPIRSQFLPFCMFYDFSLADLLAPSKRFNLLPSFFLIITFWHLICFHPHWPRSSSAEKDRTLTVLSAIMNFLYFRKERCDVMAEKVAHYVRGTTSLSRSCALLKTYGGWLTSKCEFFTGIFSIIFWLIILPTQCYACTLSLIIINGGKEAFWRVCLENEPPSKSKLPLG